MSMLDRARAIAGQVFRDTTGGAVQPAAASTPLPGLEDLVPLDEMPTVKAANDKVEAARQKVATLDAQLTEARQQMSAIEEHAPGGQGDVGAYDAAEAAMRAVGRDLRWAKSAEALAEDERGEVRSAARSAMVDIALRALGNAQYAVLIAAEELAIANSRLGRTMLAVEKSGMNLGIILEQRWPLIDFEMLRRWEQNARWLKFSDAETGPA